MIRNYRQALHALYRRANFEVQRVRQPEALRLVPVRRLLAALGDPHHAFPVVHIAGTKGKGSTAAMMEAVFRAAGYRTGLYTSPHLHTVRERIWVQGEPLSQAAFVELMQALQRFVDADPNLTVFDTLTAMAFLAFARFQVDVAVVEVGLGGRLDSTNVVCPQLTLVTRLGLDHTEVLGPTLRDIAYEKAGIFKPGVPAVTVTQAPEAMEVLRRVAEDRGVPLHVVEPSAILVEEVTPRGQRIRLRDDQGAVARYRLALLGEHQAENAALVAAAVDMLRARGWSVPPSALEEGLATVHWPGRFEVLREDPPIVLDGAHNRESGRALARSLAQVFPDRTWTVVFGLSRGKAPGALLQALQAHVDVATLWVVRSRHPRAVPVEELAPQVEAWGWPVRTAASVDAAFRQALEEGNPLVVTGSLFVVAEARETWAALGHMPAPEGDPWP